MSKNFEEYKRKKQMTEAYEKAVEIQEAIALTVCQSGGSAKEYEGHIAVNDILGKIDAMVRLFEKSIQDNDFQESSGKIIEIICNLYDLAQIKMAEARKQAKSYMEKATGVQVASEEEPENMSPDMSPDIGPDMKPDSTEEEPDTRSMAFKTRGPMQPPGKELDTPEPPPE